MVQSVKEAWQVAPPSTTSLTVSGLSTLANGASATSAVIDNYNGGANQFTELVLEISVTTAGTGTPGPIEVYLQSSLNNSTFDDVANDEQIGLINAPATSSTYNKTVRVARQIGKLPPYGKVRFNNLGCALTAATVIYNLGFETVG